MKKCSKCKTEKTPEQFGKRADQKDGLSYWCRSCVSIRNKDNYSKNREQIRKDQKEYEKNNRENRKAITDRHIAKDPEGYKGKRRTYYEGYYEDNKENILDKNAKFKEENPEWAREYNAKYARQKRKGDLNFRLAHNLRTRLNSVITGRKKSGSAVRDLGCSLDELRIYIASLFESGMSWDNYGKWHIDHIYPLSRVDLSNREEFLKACHYTNLQPLWAIDNIKKSDRIDYET